MLVERRIDATAVVVVVVGLPSRTCPAFGTACFFGFTQTREQLPVCDLRNEIHGDRM